MRRNIQPQTPNMPLPTTLRHKESWSEHYRNTTIEIVKWGFDTPNSDWPQCWNTYIYLYEKYCVDFESLWLSDRIVKLSSGFITHAYGKSPLNQLDMHYGITFYSKHGYTPGHRAIQIGDDYQHSYDVGQHYNEHYLYQNIKRFADKAIGLFYKPEFQRPEGEA